MSNLNFRPGFLGSLVALLLSAWLPGAAYAGYAATCQGCHGALQNGSGYPGGSIRAANNRAFLDAQISINMMGGLSGLSAASRDAIVAEIGNGSLGVVSAASITSGALPGGTVGTFYSRTVTASGAPQLALGSAATGIDPLPNAFTISSGALPNGLSINGSSGVISGTPTVGGTFTGTISAYNNVGAAATQNFSITIIVPPSNDNFSNAASIN